MDLVFAASQFDDIHDTPYAARNYRGGKVELDLMLCPSLASIACCGPHLSNINNFVGRIRLN